MYRHFSIQHYTCNSVLVIVDFLVVFVITLSCIRRDITRHNSAESVPSSNLVFIKEVAIRTTFCIAGIIY